MKDQNQNSEDQLRLENEIQKINLEINHGATSFYSAEDLPPEIEKMFLDNVTQFEANYAAGKQIPIYDFIGQPDLPDFESIQDFKTAVEDLQNILEQKNIVITSPEKMTDQGFYRFLTQDFLAHEITDMEQNGMIQYFSYDEFRHDEPKFIHQHVEEFLLDLLNLNTPFEFEWMSETCRSDRDEISKEQALTLIHNFRSEYETLVPIAFQVEELIPNNGFMYLSFGIAWEGQLKGDLEKEKHEGLGICQLQLEEGEWNIQGVQMPGFKF